MNAGRLIHRVDIQQPVETQNEYGEPEVTWANLSTGLWASIEPLRGREYWAMQQIQTEIDTRIVIRHVTGITHKMRIVNGADEYYIISINDVDERHKELHLMCARYPE